MVLAAFFTAGYFYLNYRRQSQIPVVPQKSNAESTFEQNRSSPVAGDPFASVADNHPKTRDEKYDRLKKLSPEVQITYFGELLGKPIFKNFSIDRDQIEYVFVDDDYYVQAVTNPDAMVLAYSVTTRTSDFFPIYDDKTIKIILGKTSLRDATPANLSGQKPLSCYAFFTGATAPSYYFERYYFGKPYITYLFGINQAGIFDFKNFSSLNNNPIADEQGKTANFGCANDESREKTPFNTYMVISSNIEYEKINEQFRFGVNPIQMDRLAN